MTQVHRAGLLLVAVLTLLATADWLGVQFLAQGVPQQYGAADLAVTGAAGAVCGLCVLGARRGGAWWSAGAAAVALAGLAHVAWLRLGPVTYGYVLSAAPDYRSWPVDVALLLLSLAAGAAAAVLAVLQPWRARSGAGRSG